MQFNPYQAVSTLGDPATSQGGINNLLQMQQNTLNGLVDSFGNIGKTSRTNTVNDLIARGGLEGLNEAQTQARIQKEAGGTLTPEGQEQVNKLLQTVGKQDQQKFTTAERLGGQEYSTGERIAGEETAKGVAKLLNENSVKKDKIKAEADLNEFSKQLEETKRQHSDANNSVESDALGRLWKINKVTGVRQLLVGAQKPITTSGNGSGDGTSKEKQKILNEDVFGLIKASGVKAENAIRQFYADGEFNVKKFETKDANDIKTVKYQGQWYGQPIHTSEMRNIVENKIAPSRFKKILESKNKEMADKLKFK